MKSELRWENARIFCISMDYGVYERRKLIILAQKSNLNFRRVSYACCIQLTSSWTSNVETNSEKKDIWHSHSQSDHFYLLWRSAIINMQRFSLKTVCFIFKRLLAHFESYCSFETVHSVAVYINYVIWKLKWHVFLFMKFLSRESSKMGRIYERMHELQFH